MRSRFWVFLAAIWVISFLSLLPAAYSPWHGLDRELLSAPTASLRSLDAWSLGRIAPGEFLGWWSLAQQRRWSGSPLGFRLVNLFLVSAIVLFFALALAGEDLQALARRPEALWEIIPATALFAFHPFLNDLVANAYARAILLAWFWGLVAYLLLRRAFAGEIERPFSLLFGVIFYLLALACHPSATLVLAAISWPILFQSGSPPRNWGVVAMLFAVSLVDFTLALVWANSPINFLIPEFYQETPGEVRSLTLMASFFPNATWFRTWLFLLASLILLIAWTWGRKKAVPRKLSFSWFWHLVYLLGLSSAAIALLQLPAICLAGPLLVAGIGYRLIRTLRADSVRPELTTLVAAVLCGGLAVGFLILGSARGQTFQQELARARLQVRNFPEWSLAWRDLGLALLAVQQQSAGQAILSKTLNQFPEDYQTRLALVEQALEQGDRDQARQGLDRLERDAPDHWEVGFYLCALAAREGDLSEAERYCKTAVDDRPGSALALNYLATVLLRGRRLDQADNLLREAKNREPRTAAIINNLGYLAEQKQELEQALSLYQQASDLDPAQSLYLKNAAHIYYLRQQIPQAVASLEAAVNVNPRDLQARANLARLLYQIQDLGRAREQAETLIRIAPDSSEAQEMRQLIPRMGQTATVPGPRGGRLR